SFSIKSIILLYIRQFSFAFFVLALKTLYKGTAFFNIYFSESFFTLTYDEIKKLKGVCMKKYLSDIFGVNVKIENWDGKLQLPLYLRNKREYYMLSLGERQSILIQFLLIKEMP
ncbi:MAG: hypothetical protein J6B84_01095, partial [Eubacterium sp.]|nr:hypothetical protein [Eubacterium sp.]